MYQSLVTRTIIILISLLILVAIMLPILLKSLGLHPDFDSKIFKLDGRKALIIASSHNVLNLPGEVRGKQTGVASSELTVPYYEFMNSGMDVDLASIKGGEIPIDSETLYYFFRTSSDKKFQNDVDRYDSHHSINSALSLLLVASMWKETSSSMFILAAMPWA